MTLTNFIKENKQEINEAIKRALNGSEIIDTDQERRLWILNDEGLYNWARSEGVKI